MSKCLPTLYPNVIRTITVRSKNQRKRARRRRATAVAKR